MRNVLLYGLGGVIPPKLYKVDTPGGMAMVPLEKAKELQELTRLYNEAYKIAYVYSLNVPDWEIFNQGIEQAEAELERYRVKMATIGQSHDVQIDSSKGTVNYSILLPDGNFYKTTDKAAYEQYGRYVSLYNECYLLAVKYGFAKPVWAQFQAGQGENILKQYKTLEANKLTADKEEAARIAAAATERAKAEADARAAENAQSAASAEVILAKQTGDTQATQTAQAALAKTVQKAAEAQQAAQVAQAADVTYEAPATTGNTQTATKKGGIPWWGWALGIVGGGLLIYKVFGGKKKGKKK